VAGLVGIGSNAIESNLLRGRQILYPNRLWAMILEERIDGEAAAPA
jgi:hypothetical protein